MSKLGGMSVLAFVSLVGAACTAPGGSGQGGGFAGSGTQAAVLPPGMTLEQWEDETIREALRRANGNKSQAARALGLSRNALRYRLSKLGVPDPEGKES